MRVIQERQSQTEMDYRTGGSIPKLRTDPAQEPLVLWSDWRNMPQNSLVHLPDSTSSINVIQVRIGQTILTLDCSKAGQIRFVQETFERTKPQAKPRPLKQPRRPQPRKPSRGRKHVAAPASADEIRRNLEVTPQETSHVRQVL